MSHDPELRDTESHDPELHQTESPNDDEQGLFLPGDDFQPWQRPVRIPWDDDEPDPEATTYTGAVHGPEPVPDWVITKDAARQRELGVLKTGKEADVSLVERWLPATSTSTGAAHAKSSRNLLAAKRYRQHRAFHNDARYRRNRRTGNRRTDLAMARNTDHGRAARSAMWATAEFDTLCLLWQAGVAVPYPVQLLGQEIMLEFLGDEEGAAPRLVETHPSRTRAAAWYEQAVELVRGMARQGVIHGDLSPYNVLVWHDRLYVIDVPQAQQGAADPDTIALLEHDVLTMCAWFERRGVVCDAADLLADALVDAMR